MSLFNKKWIVVLEKGVWLTDGDGDPPRTLIKENALRYEYYEDAHYALINARAFRPFKDAEIILEAPTDALEGNA